MTDTEHVREELLKAVSLLSTADYLTKKVRFIAPVEVMAGEFEMEALAAGAARVLSGRETAHRFRDLAKGE